MNCKVEIVSKHNFSGYDFLSTHFYFYLDRFNITFVLVEIVYIGTHHCNPVSYIYCFLVANSLYCYEKLICYYKTKWCLSICLFVSALQKNTGPIELTLRVRLADKRLQLPCKFRRFKMAVVCLAQFSLSMHTEFTTGARLLKYSFKFQGIVTDF